MTNSKYIKMTGPPHQLFCLCVISSVNLRWPPRYLLTCQSTTWYMTCGPCGTRDKWYKYWNKKEPPRNSNPWPPPSQGAHDGTRPPGVHFIGDTKAPKMYLYYTIFCFFSFFRYSIISHGRPGRQDPRADGQPDGPVPPPDNLTGRSHELNV
jgi:hypothetical protein